MFIVTSARWQRVQTQTWPWLTLIAVLAIEFFADGLTTWLTGGALPFLLAKSLLILIALALLNYFLLRPAARSGASAALGLLSACWVALLYAWLLAQNILQLAAHAH